MFIGEPIGLMKLLVVSSYWYNFDTNYWGAIYKHKENKHLKWKAGYESDNRLGYASLWVRRHTWMSGYLFCFCFQGVNAFCPFSSIFWLREFLIRPGNEPLLDGKRSKYIGQLELDPLHWGDLCSILALSFYTSWLIWCQAQLPNLETLTTTNRISLGQLTELLAACACCSADEVEASVSFFLRRCRAYI